MVETTTLEVGAGLLDADKVTDRTYKIYMTEGKGEFVRSVYELKDPIRIAEDAADGGNGTFAIINFEIPVVQMWPERGKGDARRLEFRMTRAQAEAVEEGTTPALHVGTPVGRLVRQIADLKVADKVDSDGFGGEVFVVAEYSNSYNGRDERRHDFVAHIGDRLNHDLERGVIIAQEEAAGSKQTATGGRKAAY